MRYPRLFAFALFVVVSAAACDNGTSTPPSIVAPTVPKYTTMPSNAELLADKVTGNASAQNTIYEYVSFFCPACAQFHATTEPQIKSQFADTGQAKIVFRNLFFYGANPPESETDAMLARCVGDADFFSAVDYLFTYRSKWVSTSDPEASVKNVMLGFGMSQSLIDTCAANTTLRNALAQTHDAALAQTYQLPDGTTVTGIKALPALVVNGVKLDGTDASGAANDNFTPTVDHIAKLIK